MFQNLSKILNKNLHFRKKFTKKEIFKIFLKNALNKFEFFKNVSIYKNFKKFWANILKKFNIENFKLFRKIFKLSINGKFF